MSAGQIEQFYSRASNDPAILNKLMGGTQTPDEFIDKAVAIGAETGFSFTRDEADTWVKGQIAAKANGELSDLQLEGVAGGKSRATERAGMPAEVVTACTWIGNNVAGPFEGWLNSW
jgi:predicted ribosomally synthesized peptide with nif11-like leader